jgi:hypothetical protein
MPHVNVTMSDAGVMQSSGDSQTRVNQWSFKSARWSSLINAEKNIDRAIQILHKNIDDTYLSDFKESEKYHSTKSMIFDTASIIDFAPIRTWRAFRSVLPFIRRAEGKLLELLGNRTMMRLFDDDDKEKKLLEHARWYVATSALLDAVPNLSIYYEANNITVVSSIDGIEAGIGIFSQPHVELVDNLLKKLKEESSTHFQNVKNHLRVNRDFFTEWAEDCYSEGKSSMIYHSDDEIGGLML